jgi:hypothetical protein
VTARRLELDAFGARPVPAEPRIGDVGIGRGAGAVGASWARRREPDMNAAVRRLLGARPAREELVVTRPMPRRGRPW